MFALAFDLLTETTAYHHPKSVRQAYADIQATLATFEFERVQGNVYLTDNDSMTNLLQAVLALKNLDWFPPSVRDIRGFRVENWSDFTSMVKAA